MAPKKTKEQDLHTVWVCEECVGRGVDPVDASHYGDSPPDVCGKVIGGIRCDGVYFENMSDLFFDEAAARQRRHANLQQSPGVKVVH
jgi:hypothetical protein